MRPDTSATSLPPTSPSQAPSDQAGGFFPGLLRVTAELENLKSEPLRLHQLDARLMRLQDLENEFLITDDQYDLMSEQQREIWGRYISAWSAERARIRHAHSDPGVIADTWEALERVWQLAFPGREPSREKVLCVLQGEPDLELTEIILPEVTVAPRGRSRWQWSLLHCPEWLYEALQAFVEEVEARLSAPLKGLTPAELEFITALWEDDPKALYFKLETALEAARNLH
jgi:hypothetical protein